MAATFSVAIAGQSQAANLPIFFQNFDGGGFVIAPTTGGMTGYVNTQPLEGFAGLGTGTNVVSGLYLHNASGDNFTNSPSLKSTIQLSGLPAHSGIQLKFLFALIDTWDGNAGDFFHVDVDGVSRFKETFYNGGSGSQSYVPPAGVTIVHDVDLAVESFRTACTTWALIRPDLARFRTRQARCGLIFTQMARIGIVPQTSRGRLIMWRWS